MRTGREMQFPPKDKNILVLTMESFLVDLELHRQIPLS